MTWRDRLRPEAAFTSASGQRLVFKYEDVEELAAARGTVFEYPDVSGAYVQRSGQGPRRYPIRAFFSGSDCDLLGDAFFEMVLEDGVGRLEHPRYGAHDVVALGEVAKRDDLKSAANQTVVEVTFWKTLGSAFPEPGVDVPSLLAASLDSFNVAASGRFGTATSLSSTVARVNMRASSLNALAKVRGSLRSVASASSSTLRTFDGISSSINQGIDALVAQPVSLALQFSRLVQTPGRALASIQARLEGYANLIDSLFRLSPEGDSGVGGLETLEDTRNRFALSDHLALSAVSGSALSCAENQFSTRPQAIAAAEELLRQLDLVIAWRDERADDLSVIDTGESFQAIQELVSLTAGYLIQVSFSLLPERALVTDRARTMIDLCAELYGSIDDRLDFFIDSNDLSGDEILEIPAGRRLVYYV